MNHSVPDDHHVVVNHRSLVLPDEEGVESPQRLNSVDSVKVESSGGSVTRKGFGLKKWRRIKREGVGKDEAAARSGDDDGGKFLKRGLTGLVSPPFKHVDLSSVEARQSSEGSVGSVNMVLLHHLQGVGNGFGSDPGFGFTVGQAFEKGEGCSGNSLAAKNVGGKILKDTVKNGREEVVKTEEDKRTCSSLDSDLRSGDFVFSSGLVSVAKTDERLMMNQSSKEGETYRISQNGGQEEDGDESKNNNRYEADKDHITDSIRSLGALHEALWKELKSYQELGKEYIPLHSNIDEVNCREEKSTSSGSQVLILKQKIKHLQHKLKEARAELDAKEARIEELECSKIETELECIFQRKIEAEIEHLMLTRSLSSSLQVLKEQPNKVHSQAEDSEPNRGNMLGKTCKSSVYFLIQLILLVFILRLMLLQCSPASRLVIPT